MKFTAHVIKQNFNHDLYILDQNDNNSLLGKGSFGSVYRARLKDGNGGIGLPDEVAVKVISWEDATGYEETEWTFLEYGIDFKHENIVQYFGLTMDVRGKMKIQHIYMELCHEALNEFTDRTNVSITDIRHVTHGVLKGLVHLHEQNIIHRDLKLENIMLKKPSAECTSIQEMVIKLSDFNISKLGPQGKTGATATAGMGSRGFKAPEVLIAQPDGITRYSKQCDIWSVGVLVFQLRKRVVFASEEDIKSGALNIEEEIKKVPEENVQSFLHKCLKIEPKERDTSQGLLSHRFLEV